MNEGITTQFTTKCILKRFYNFNNVFNPFNGDQVCLNIVVSEMKFNLILHSAFLSRILLKEKYFASESVDMYIIMKENNLFFFFM